MTRSRSRKVPDITSPWEPFEDRRRARDIKREAVLRVAVHLFLEQGYDRTSLNEVAERLNITKPALYNYFANKEEILVECYSLGQELSEGALTRMREQAGDGLFRLRGLIRGHALTMAQDFGQCLVRIDDRVLSPEARREVRAGKRLIDAGFRAFISEGIADGSIRPCDVKLTAFAIAGALNWIGHWIQPDGDRSPEQIADEMALRLTEGIANTA